MKFILGLVKLKSGAAVICAPQIWVPKLIKIKKYCAKLYDFSIKTCVKTALFKHKFKYYNSNQKPAVQTDITVVTVDI